MHENEESPISKLLQMRRHQQPPPEYFENFLREFQERQRAELLRRPAWRIAMERLGIRLSDAYQTLFGPFATSHIAYATASAAVLTIAAVYSTNLLQNPGGVSSGIAASRSHQIGSPHPFESRVSSSRQSAPVSFEALNGLNLPQRGAEQRSFDLFPGQSRPGGYAIFELTPEQIFALQHGRHEAEQPTTPTRQHPQYILDARPATYEPPISF